ncbi:hypothetical protein HK405_008910 [Cladochytrium tenue]|nr:hypothetical protein HK405_008910 [Cladochytrium tenue]
MLAWSREVVDTEREGTRVAVLTAAVDLSLVASPPPAAAPASDSTALVLIYAHAIGLCKELWLPLIHELVHRLNTDGSHGRSASSDGTARRWKSVTIHTFDAFYAGDSAILNNRAEAVSAAAASGTHKSMEIDWDDLARDSASLARWARARALRENPGAPAVTVVGVGHSCGSYSLFRAAMLAPGCVDAVVAMDPPLLVPGKPWLIQYLKASGRVVLQRPPAFASRSAALDWIRGSAMMKGWAEQCIQLYLEHAFAPASLPAGTEPPSSSAAGDVAVRLKCSPVDEGATLRFSDQRDTFARLREPLVPIFLALSGRSAREPPPPDAPPGFKGETWSEVVFKHMPRANIRVVRMYKPLSHMLAVEDPAALAAFVHDAITDLRRLPVVETESKL